MIKSEPVITFTAAVYKISTLVDGGIRLTLDLPETAIAQAAMLMEAKQQGIPLMFEAKADEDGLTKLDDEIKKSTEKRITRVGRVRA